MPLLHTGGCACGALRYTTAAKPVFQNHCQCVDCRRRSGAGHSSYLTFADGSQVEITGEVRYWRVTGDSGNDKLHAFCPVCGAPVFLTFAARPDLLAVHAGSLDDPALFRPEALTYAARGPAWDTVDPALPAYGRMAPQ